MAACRRHYNDVVRLHMIRLVDSLSTWSECHIKRAETDTDNGPTRKGLHLDRLPLLSPPPPQSYPDSIL